MTICQVMEPIYQILSLHTGGGFSLDKYLFGIAVDGFLSFQGDDERIVVEATQKLLLITCQRMQHSSIGPSEIGGLCACCHC